MDKYTFQNQKLNEAYVKITTDILFWKFVFIIMNSFVTLLKK